MKKFITVNTEGRVQLIHNMPFDAVNGLGKTETQLMSEGYLLDMIPEPQIIDGKNAVAMYNAENGFYYIYEDVPQKAENYSFVDNLKNAVKAEVVTAEQYFQMTGIEYK